MKKTFKNSYAVFVAVLFIFFVFLSYIFPYSGDDWSWGTKYGMDLLKEGFADYNGRYLGNILEMVATRVRPLRALMEGALLTSLVVLMGALNDHKRKTVTVGAAVLVLLTSREIWQQAIVWAAGFFNYVPPLVAALFFVWCIKRALDGNGRENKVLPTLLLTLVGFLSCLCMENMTVFSLVLGIAAVGYVLFTRKKLWGITTGWLIGTVIGTIVMFSNGGYAANEMGYRSLTEDIKQSIDLVFRYGMYQNTVLNVILTVLLLWFVGRKMKEMRGKKLLLCQGLCLYNILWVIYAVLNTLNAVDYYNPITFSYLADYKWQVVGTYTPLFNALLGLGYLVSCFALLLLTADHRRLQVRVWALYGSLGVMVTPLFIVTPIGPRNFFAPYVVQILIACMLFAEMMKERPTPRIAAATLMSALVALCLFHTSIYAYIYKVDRQRMEYVREQVATGEKTVEVIIWPYEEYVWWPRTVEEAPGYKAKKRNFRRFLGIPDKAEVEFITLAEYYAEHPDKIS